LTGQRSLPGPLQVCETAADVKKRNPQKAKPIAKDLERLTSFTFNPVAVVPGKQVAVYIQENVAVRQRSGSSG